MTGRVRSRVAIADVHGARDVGRIIRRVHTLKEIEMPGNARLSPWNNGSRAARASRADEAARGSLEMRVCVVRIGRGSAMKAAGAGAAGAIES
uniref:hypothetical protein n=1 Tax=Burkholderia anthina TaxID=179879 RepID=UPI00158C9C2C|nr:hypothetical protein [Burkholderia anthina]